MLDHWRRWRDRRYLARHPLPDDLWASTADVPSLAHLDAAERTHLRALATLFLRDKAFYGAHDLPVTDEMRVRVAAEGCLPLLHLDGRHYTDFASVVLYETSFVARREERDEAGVVHETETEMLGESWDRGPLILSWEDVLHPPHDGANVVLHEFAHKLDGTDGVLDGRPPLRRGMRGADWQHAFQAAYDDLCARVDAAGDDEVDSDVDPYGAEAPEEFFAVCVELFFMAPELLHGQYPDVYAQLRSWLGQDPLRVAPPIDRAEGAPTSSVPARAPANPGPAGAPAGTRGPHPPRTRP
jgi:hypothetical protein